MKNNYNIIGLMSGTSVDGLDIAYVQINDKDKLKINLIEFETVTIPFKLKNKIIKSFAHKETSRFFCSLNFEIGKFFGDSVNNFIKKHNIAHNEIDYISSHGQTIYHLIDPKNDEIKSTLQFGDISIIAKTTNIPVIGDFRPADMGVGGEGAPLVVYPDYLLFNDNNEVRLLQNIGGISNVTVLNNDINKVFAFDNGPGNVLIDMAVKHFFNLDYDKDAKIAKNGKIINEIIDFLLLDDYYEKQPPKTTGREKYNKQLLDILIKKFDSFSPFDIVRSITYFTSLTIANSYKKFVIKPENKYSVYLSGGGANNPLILQDLKTLLPQVNVATSNDLGINSDAKEAIEFALLGYLFVKNLNGNLPKATGARDFTILGKLAK